ncbi:DedA family protein [Nitrobacter sp. JJSN]|uniref:DedA family protein n=1 Tax=Nitrobacter sp. JJSN TaxID=3453033 RepID=UPI003F75E0D7
MSVIDAHVIQELVTSYGYLAVFTIVLLESAGLPLPGETALIAAAVYAGTLHTMDIRFIIVAAALGAILGDNLGFWVGRRFGRKILVKYGHYIGIDQQKLDLAEYLYLRHGGKIVFFGRFVALLRALAAIFAGASHFPPLRFFIYNAAGGIVWATLFGSGGYFLGQGMRRAAGPLGWIVLAIAFFGGLALWRYFKNNEDRLFDDAKRALESRNRSGANIQKARH